MRRVTIIGDGVIGLTIAHEFATAGDQVAVVADVETSETVSALSAALWFPYRSERSFIAQELLSRSLSRFVALSRVVASGVEMRDGTVVERTLQPDRWWTEVVPGVTDEDPAFLPVGAVSGVRASVPLVNIPIYLEWLRDAVVSLGVGFRSRTVRSLDEFTGSADIVIVAAGIRSGDLVGGDSELVPVAGQVVRVANPGLTRWIADEGNPAGLTYVIPRRNDVVVGGTAIAGSWDLNVDPEVEAGILERATRLVPALRDQPIIGRGVGLRPARSSIRLEQIGGAPVPTIAAYGHGGAGVTLSWGTAERVVALSETYAAST